MGARELHCKIEIVEQCISALNSAKTPAELLARTINLEGAIKQSQLIIESKMRKVPHINTHSISKQKQNEVSQALAHYFVIDDWLFKISVKNKIMMQKSLSDLKRSTFPPLNP